MEILVTPDGDGRYIISSPGCMEWRARMDFAKALNDSANGQDVSGVILDLDGVNYMNSAGLGAIFVLRKATNQLDASFVIARPSPAILRLLETANLPALIPVADDLEQARKLLASNNCAS